MVRPIFLQTPFASTDMPSASPQDLADAVVDCVESGARILNLSLALAPSPNSEPRLAQALDYAAARGTLVVSAAGNQGTVGALRSLARLPAYTTYPRHSSECFPRGLLCKCASPDALRHQRRQRIGT
jgi:subtilisin family serine protease